MRTHGLCRQIVNRAGDYVRPETGAVFADAPSVDFHSPMSDYGSEVALRRAALRRLGGIEAGNRTADDLRGRVTDDAFRAQVPARDAPVRVEREDRVLLDAIDK